MPTEQRAAGLDRIAGAFANHGKRAALMPYLMGGFPYVETSLAVGEAYADAIPGARLVVEDEGKSPLAWQGAQVSKVIAELASAVRA